MARILIGGDLVLEKCYKGELDDKLLQLFASVDYRVLNLESPITDADSKYKIIKTGPHLKGEMTSTKQVLLNLNIDLVTLDNNHILDYGNKGVSDTLSFCASLGLDYVGAGNSLIEASEIFYKKINNHRIAFVNVSENEWNCATKCKAGANPLDLINNAKAIREAKNNADKVFVIIHGGHEYYNYPSLRMQNQYRFYVDMGADLVVGHHPHCISGYEIYKNTPITQIFFVR